MPTTNTRTGRPRHAPKRIPMWAWELEHWQRHGRKGPRPTGAPRRVPAWYWAWKAWGLRRARRAGAKHPANPPTPPPPAPTKHPPTTRQRIVYWARWGAHNEPEIHYTMSSARDDWLVQHYPKGKLPIATDCSGEVTRNYRWAEAPDPNGLGYRYLGYTGTLLDHAYRHGRVFTDVSKALPGDPIVIGPGTGWHVVSVIEAGPDPLVESHGLEEGPKIQRLSVDHREPKRVCQTLPA